MLEPTTRDKKIPKAPVVSLGGLAKMVAKKTKFRVVDVEEVLDEAVEAIFALLLQRKSVDLHGLYLESAWHRYRGPIYFHNPEKWNFGYYIPELKMARNRKSMLIHSFGEKTDKVLEKVRPYLPDDLVDATNEEIYDYLTDMFYSSGEDGKEVVVSPNNKVYNMKGKETKRSFDEDYHPDFLEAAQRSMAVKRIIKEIGEMVKENPELDFKTEFDRIMDERGIYRYDREKEPADD